MSGVNIKTWTESIYAPRFEIEIDNSKLDIEMLSAISEIEVNENLNEGASFTFVVNYEVDNETQERPWLDDERFDIGGKVNIKIGYETNFPVVIMGVITGLETEISKEAAPSLTVRGQDLAYDYMKRKSPGRTFKDASYSDIAEMLANEAGLTAEVEAAAPYEGIVRKYSEESYFAFLERLGRKIGYKIRIEGQTMYFAPPEDDREEVLILEYGRDIISLTPGLNTSQLCTEVEVRGCDPGDPGTPIIGRAETGSERRQEPGKKTASQLAKECCGDLKIEITNVAVQSVDDANAIAEDVLNNTSDTLLQAEVKCIGTPDIKTGMCVSIQKVGKRFSGKYFVTGVTHTLDKSGFLTNLTVKRNAL